MTVLNGMITVGVNSPPSLRFVVAGINQNVAKALGITGPLSVLALADERVGHVRPWLAADAHDGRSGAVVTSAPFLPGRWDGRLAHVPCSLRYGEVVRFLSCSLTRRVLRMPAFDQPTYAARPTQQ
jgi:hypothetical protein